MKVTPTIARLAEAFAYDKKTGVFTWRLKTNKRIVPGKVAGALRPAGYINLKLDGVQLQGHRVAWALTYGSWPDGWIDHRNGNRADNRISNLRIATPTEQNRNKRRQSNNKSGATGVAWVKAAGAWQARIVVNKKPTHLGFFKSVRAASAAYRKAARLHFGEFYARGRS